MIATEKRHIVCIDGDGCAFDTMEIKHKECFCPAYIEYFGLQAVSRYAREAWEFVNLYAATRGIHRMHALLRSMDLLALHPQVRARGFAMPDMAPLRRWVQSAETFSNDALAVYAQEHPEQPILCTTLAWSMAVNRRVTEMVHGIPPFTGVRERLAALRPDAAIVVVSATPFEALAREQHEHGIDAYVDVFYGQEAGSKQQLLSQLRGQFEAGHMLMIGDAPGDLQAAQANGVPFYPIYPGQETESWVGLAEGFAGLAAGGAYGTQEVLVAGFLALLPESASSLENLL